MVIRIICVKGLDRLSKLYLFNDEEDVRRMLDFTTTSFGIFGMILPWQNKHLRASVCPIEAAPFITLTFLHRYDTQTQDSLVWGDSEAKELFSILILDICGTILYSFWKIAAVEGQYLSWKWKLNIGWLLAWHENIGMDDTEIFCVLKIIWFRLTVYHHCFLKQ